MNDRELETLLQTLAPRRLPPHVLAVSPEAEAVSPASEALRFWRGWLGWSCAALFVVGLIASRMVRPAGKADAAVPAAPVASIFVQGGEEDLVTLADGSAARRYRIHSLETVSWTDPKSNAALRWTLPREDVHVVPVRVY